MTPYQRGNRDGLLSLAIDLERLAQAEREEAARLSRHRTMGERLATNRHFAADALDRAARVARTRAEALPDDPEVPPTPDGNCPACHRDALRTDGRGTWLCAACGWWS